MGLWRRLTGPGNSLILQYDHLTSQERENFEEQVSEVGKFYRWVRLSDLADAAKAGDFSGLAALTFKYPRKSMSLYALPYLRAENIPVTIFLPSEGVGMNRLPPEEEIAAFKQGYPSVFSEEKVRELLNEAWESPETLEGKLKDFRGEIGPLPIEKLDPTRFLTTWGKLFEIPPPLREFGLHLNYNPRHAQLLDESLKFLSRQTGQAVRMAYCERNFDGFEKFGLSAVVGTATGAVERGVSLGNLPVWPLLSTFSQ